MEVRTTIETLSHFQSSVIHRTIRERECNKDLFFKIPVAIDHHNVSDQVAMEVDPDQYNKEREKYRHVSYVRINQEP